MKYVRKTGAPHDYINWCNRVRGTDDEDYRRLRNPERSSLHRALLSEQGGLCAYTMRRINEKNSHIEHIKPEGLCRTDRVGSDLDYENLLACFPQEGMNRKCRYGAQLKDDWWANNGVDFVSPLRQDCEQRFCFDLDGEIHPVYNYQPAVETIRILRLDHKSLTEDRKRVIREFVLGESGSDAPSQTQASRLIQAICERGVDGHFREFCVAIRDALKEYIKTLRKRANRRRFARRR
jgi:uncharacterized protein (TIGR02646 family)